MLDTLLKYAYVYLGSMFKFVLGPMTGTFSHLTFIETAIFTTLGMMTTVLIISLLGEPLRKRMIQRFRRNKPLFTKRNRMIVRVWSRFGLKGVAFLTPLLLSPIGGAIIATSFGGSRRKLFTYMFISAAAWGVVQSFLFLKFGNLLGY